MASGNSDHRRSYPFPHNAPTESRLSQLFDPILNLAEDQSPRYRLSHGYVSSSPSSSITSALSDAELCGSSSRDSCGQVNWQERCMELELSLQKYRDQATRVREILHEKLLDMEQRLVDAEARAEEAEEKVRMMEEQLQTGEINGGTSLQEKDEFISCLESQVEEQRQLRMQDAKQVEAKAAKIKEWVTNKLRELEEQNEHLRLQNQKCNEQLELLRNRLLQLSQLSCQTHRSSTEDSSRGSFDGDRADSEENYNDGSSPLEELLFKGRSTDSGSVDVGSPLSLSPKSPHSSRRRSSILEAHQSSQCISGGLPLKAKAADEIHDYSEIYTPSKEQVAWGEVTKPPTPPLHRFPSWESRIYQVASEGLSLCGDNVLTNSHMGSIGSGYCGVSVPVYATVKGRASQIRPFPFTGDSSDSDSGEEALDTDSSSSPSKSLKTPRSPTVSLSPSRRTSSVSPSKLKERENSLESGLSDDYAIPPDCVDSCSLTSETPCRRRQGETLEKAGYLTKLGGKLKSWSRRWFLLRNGVLSYWKSQSDIHRKPLGRITLDEVCRVTRAEGAATFEISTGKRSYYLTAESIPLMEEWIRVLQNVLRRNATKLLLSKEDVTPTMKGWLTKVKHGHAKRCWCLLVGKMFLYFRSPQDTTPLGQINMRDARVEEVEHVSDSEEENEKPTQEVPTEYTVGIFPSHQTPTYLLLPDKSEKDQWLYHLTVVSGGGPSAGTQYEQLVQKLMEMDGDPNCILWRHPLLLYSKDCITTPLTTHPSGGAEAIKLFKSVQLFVSVRLDTAGIDYHVVLAQNALAQCLSMPELQSELIAALIKQTSKHSRPHHSKSGVQVNRTFSKLKHSRQLLLCATQSLFLCDSSSSHKGSPTSVLSIPPPPPDCKSNPPTFVFIQGWQLLALAVSLFLPKNNKLLWYLKLHLQRSADNKTEIGKYATYCQRALERTVKCGGREAKPSRMEVLSILLKNPHHHSLPHAIPVHFPNGSYQVVGLDGSTTVEEFLRTVSAESGCRDSSQSGFALYSDDPIEKNTHHYLLPHAKVCDLISQWETALREKGSGKFENTRVIKVMLYSRLYWRSHAKTETERERVFLAYQYCHHVIHGRFPLSPSLALELASLMAQIDLGDYDLVKQKSGSEIIETVMERFYPLRYKEDITPDDAKKVQDCILDKWQSLKGRSSYDCIRIYLTCLRKWPLLGHSLYQAKVKLGVPVDGPIWLAIGETGISVLELSSLSPLRPAYSYSQVVTFGGCQEDFMLVVSAANSTIKLLFHLPKPKILDLTLEIADYMNASGVPGTPRGGTLSRHESLRRYGTRSPDAESRSSRRYQEGVVLEGCGMSVDSGVV